MQNLFNNLKNKKEVETLFIPILEALKNSNLLNQSDEISIKLLLERIDEYFSKIKEKIEYFKNVRPQLINYDIMMLDIELGNIERLLNGNDLSEKIRMNCEIKKVNLQKQKFALESSKKFQTFELKQNGELSNYSVFDVSLLTKDLINLLKENTLTNVVRTKIVNTFKLGSQQKSITQILTEMINQENNKNVS